MKIMKNRLAISCVVAALAACGGGSSETSTRPSQPLTGKEKIAALENNVDLPKLDRSDSVAGPDANGNGVRDDVEAFIESQYGDATRRAAAMQLARTFQRAVTVNPQDRDAVRAVQKDIGRSVNCVFAKFDQPSKVVRQLEGATTNTKPRLIAYLAYNKALDGTAGALPSGDTCE